MTLGSGTKLGRYEIRSKIGEGGMGEVYLALDPELDRTVAVKILPETLALDQQRLQRFVQEAKAASALNHPHILTIHEIGTVENSRFIATEFIDGATLRQHMHSPLKLTEILEIAIQTASALAAAHAAGIIHRDIKPENVMVRRDGYIKVLDFGLAKLTEPQGATTDGEAPTKAMVNTGAGTVMGTANYMSPEQAKGVHIDARSDIWSLGAMLYEMVSGHVPFPGETPTETISLILQKDAAPLTRFAPNVPTELERIVTKALTKDREERYQTMKDLLIDLRALKRKLEVDAEIDRTVSPEMRSALSTSSSQGALATGSGAMSTAPANLAHASSAEYIVSGIRNHKVAVAALAVILLIGGVTAVGFYLRTRTTTLPIRSIAVMPFVNESGNADLEYLSDGMTDTLISSLSQLPNLNVKARSSVFRYKRKETDAKTIGKELNVQAVLNGRLAQRGDQLTLTLELVDVQNENVIWSEQYSRKQADLVSLQSDIARDVSSKLKIKLSGADEQKLTKNYTQNPDAYKLYLLGRFFANKRTPKDSRKAIDCFQQAVTIDPNYALAYGGLALSYAYLTIYGDEPASETFPKAREFALKASELDGTLAGPHITLGLLKFLQDHDMAGWERETRLALAAEPNSTDAHRLNGLRLTGLGRFEEALAEEQRALEIEPLSAAANINYGLTLFYSGRIDESEAQLKKAMELAPDFWFSHYYLYYVYRFKGNYAQAVEKLAKTKDLREETEAAKLIRESFAKGGWPGFLRAVTVEHAPMKMTPYNVAGFYAETGDKDRAFAALNEAIDKADQFFGFMKVDPFIKPLHDDPRFPALLKRAGFPQ